MIRDDHFDNLMKQAFNEADFDSVRREKDAGEWVETEKETEDPLKNYPKVQRVLDLHGYNANEAQKEIRRFLTNAKSAQLQTIQIITGRGWHSPDFKAVLPEITEKKLAELKKEDIVYRFKKEKSGGAFIVYLT